VTLTIEKVQTVEQNSWMKFKKLDARKLISASAEPARPQRLRTTTGEETVYVVNQSTLLLVDVDSDRVIAGTLTRQP
jgi:hypothetical protein